MASDPTSARVSSYLEYLPAIFTEEPFVGQFLLAFERILTGLQPQDTSDPAPEQPGLEEYVDRLYTYLAPGQASSDRDVAPAEFLPWLASWVALSLRDDWEEDFKRRFISNIVSLYRQRGTKQGLEQLLNLYTNEKVVIDEFDEPPYYFQVSLTLADLSDLGQKEAIARDLLDREKPAHTFYNLRFLIATMQINNTYHWPEDATEENWSQKGVTGLRVGWNTILGTETTLGN